MDCIRSFYDVPLTYEKSWGQNINYVLGFSHQEIVDITYKYTEQRTKINSKREKLVDDKWLNEILETYRQ